MNKNTNSYLSFRSALFIPSNATIRNNNIPIKIKTRIQNVPKKYKIPKKLQKEKIPKKIFLSLSRTLHHSLLQYFSLNTHNVLLQNITMQVTMYRRFVKEQNSWNKIIYQVLSFKGTMIVFFY